VERALSCLEDAKNMQLVDHNQFSAVTEFFKSATTFQDEETAGKLPASEIN